MAAALNSQINKLKNSNITEDDKAQLRQVKQIVQHLYDLEMTQTLVKLNYLKILYHLNQLLDDSYDKTKAYGNHIHPLN